MREFLRDAVPSECRVVLRTVGFAVTAVAVTGHTGRVVWRQFRAGPEARFRPPDGESGPRFGVPSPIILGVDGKAVTH